MDIVGGEHFIGHVSLVDVDVCPLSALSLVASHGVGVFDLQGIEVLVFAQPFHPVGFQRDVGIVFQHIII